MSIGLVAIAMFLGRTPPPPKHERVSIVEPVHALRHRATRGSGLTAIFTTSASSRCWHTRRSRCT
jgi:hypothetical protein